MTARKPSTSPVPTARTSRARLDAWRTVEAAGAARRRGKKKDGEGGKPDGDAAADKADAKKDAPAADAK